MDAEPEPIPHADDNMSVMGGGDGSFADMEDLEGIVTGVNMRNKVVLLKKLKWINKNFSG